MAVHAAKCTPQSSDSAVEQARALVQAPSEIKGKNVEAIIAGWTAELEARSAAFVAHAGRLAEWDRHILTNRRELLDLEDELQRVTEFEFEVLPHLFCTVEPANPVSRWRPTACRALSACSSTVASWGCPQPCLLPPSCCQQWQLPAQA
jgi:Nsp1-like C-terminal region